MGEPEGQKTEFRRRGAGIYVLTVALLPVLYVLSIGPAARLYPNQAPQAVRTFYAPLLALAEQNHALRAALKGYIRLWLPGR
jgi:hypothetical protein